MSNSDYQWCEKLQHVQQPQTLKKIAHAAFSHCAFKDLVIPDSVTAIGEYAFDCNYNLQTNNHRQQRGKHWLRSV